MNNSKDFNLASLMSDPFAMDSPVGTDGNYSSAHVTGFNGDDENRLRAAFTYDPQDISVCARPIDEIMQVVRSGAQEVRYSSSNSLAMTPPDSCSDSFSPTAGPRYPQLQHQLPFDRAAAHPRVPSLHPPTGMSASAQKPVHPIIAMQAYLNQSNTYPSSYALQRSMGFPLNGINDVPREHGYSNTHRAPDGLDRNHAALLQQPQVESTQRSNTQPEAPSFQETGVLQSIVADFAGALQTIKPEVYAKIGRGFFPHENKWTCYRRNYFSVTCSFSLHPWPSTTSLYIRNSDETLDPIINFAMSISAIVNGQYGETRELVQHTPKRDKQSERPPPRVHLHPTPPPSLASASAGNGTHGFPLNSQPLDYNASFAGTAQPPTSHLFERIQFQKATANNGKRRAQQQFYNLVVELHAEIAGPVNGESKWVLVARRHSDSMVVRGRSPGHYKDGRRDSTASMGPDGGSGDAGGIGGGGTLSHVMGGQAARPPMLMYDASHRGGLSYGRTDYRQMSGAEQSPLSDSPPIVSSSSSSGYDYMVNETMNPSEVDLGPHPYVGGANNHRANNTGGFDPVHSAYNGYGTIGNNRGLCI